MKSPSEKISHLALLHAASLVLSDAENPTSDLRKLQKADKNGKGDAPAINYCNPCQDYENSSVSSLLEQISSFQIALLEFASRAVNVAKRKTKDPIEVSNVLKVVDIDRTLVSRKTRDFLSTYYTMYTDKLTAMGEDLIDVNSANEPDSNSKSKSKLVQAEITALAKTAFNHDAGYVRFVSH